MKLGAYRFQDAIINIDDPAVTLASEFDGLLGIGLLRLFTVGFDAGGSTLWLKPDAALGDPFVYDYSGLVEGFSNGVTTVKEASRGSPAEEAGLRPGNRLFVLKKGDAYHQSLTTKSSARRIALEDESPAATETIPRPRNEAALPEEVLAELRIINVRKSTSMAIVTTSRREIEVGDQAFARRGY